MNRIYRDGVDLTVAFTSQRRRALADGPSADGPDARAGVAAPATPASTGRVRLPAPIKRWLRPPLDAIRRYLSAPLHDELRRTQATLEDIRSVQSALQEDLRRTRAMLLQEAGYLRDRAPQLDRVERYAMASARRVAVSCGDAILVRTDLGYVVCPPGDHAAVAGLVEEGEIERGTRLLIERLIAPGDLFVDVGANLGLHTLAACRMLAGRGGVVAFEPFEPTVQFLRRTLWINGVSGLVDVHHAAVGCRPGRQRLYLGPTGGHHSLFPLSLPPGADDSPSVEVPVVTLDEAVGSRPVAAIKIDVEGAELEVLSGARLLIERNRDVAIIAELAPRHLTRAGVSTADWFAAFGRLGLVYRRVDEETGELIPGPVEGPEPLPFSSANILFSRPGSRAWARAGAASSL